MDVMESTFGRNAVLRCKGTITTSNVNLNDLATAMFWSSIFDTAYALDVTSSDVKDDGAPAGDGAQIVRIVGLDVNYNRIYEDVVMNGRTAVTTTNKFLRVFSAFVMAAGSELDNAGDIYVIKTGSSTWTNGVPDALTSACLKMVIGTNAAFSGLFTAPAGCYFKVGSIYVSSRTQAGTVTLVKANALDVTGKGPFAELKIETSPGGGAPTPDYNLTLKPKDDLYVQAIAVAASGIIGFSAQIIQTAGRYYRGV